MKKIIVCLIMLIFLCGCKNNKKEIVEEKVETITPIKIESEITQEDIDKETDIKNLKEMVEDLNNKNQKLSEIIQNKDNEIESIKQSIQEINTDDNQQLIFDFVFAINNNDSNIIDSTALQFYTSHFNNRPITKVEVKKDDSTYTLSNNEGNKINISVRDGKIVDGTLTYAKQTIDFINHYLEAIKSENYNSIKEILYPNSKSSVLQPYMQQDISFLIDTYKKNYNMNNLSINKCNKIIDDIDTNVGFKINLNGNNRQKHELILYYSYGKEFLFDHFGDVLSTDTVLQNVKHLDNNVNKSKIYKTTSASINKLNDGSTVNISNNEIVIKNNTTKTERKIVIPESIISISLSHDGKSLIYVNDRGVYLSSLNFANPKLLIAQNGGLYADNIIWSQDDKKILLWIYKGQWIEGLSIIDINGNMKYAFSNIYEWDYVDWGENESKIYLKSNYDDKRFALLDYKIFKLYTNY